MHFVQMRHQYEVGVGINKEGEKVRFDLLHVQLLGVSAIGRQRYWKTNSQTSQKLARC